MKTALAATFVVLLCFARPAFSHRLDEYLQATTISVEKNRVQAQIRLTPGIAIFPFVMSTIDLDGDGTLSAREQRVYAERVLGDLSLAVDGDRLKLQLISIKFPEVADMRAGLGQIQIDFAAHVPRPRAERKLIFDNHHQRPIAAYLVNCLAPQDPDIRIKAQKRNYEQSFYELEYVQAGVSAGPLTISWWSDGRGWLAAIAMLLLGRLVMIWRQRHVGKGFLHRQPGSSTLDACDERSVPRRPPHDIVVDQ